jgi:hypothetical protein
VPGEQNALECSGMHCLQCILPTRYQRNAHVRPLVTKMAVGRENDEHRITQGYDPIVKCTRRTIHQVCKCTCISAGLRPAISSVHFFIALSSASDLKTHYNVVSYN